MQEYLVLLIVILLLLSLVLVVIHSFFKSRIRLRARTVFATTGVSLLLGAFFPWALAAFALPAVLLIYLGVITLFAFAFSYCDMKISAHSPANPVITTEPGNEIAEPAPITSTAFEFNEKTAFAQACAALDCNAPGADQPAHIPTETSAADLPDGITPDPVQECGITTPALSHAKPELPPETVNENISAGFSAKASGDMVSALTSFMNAFSLNREPHAAVALAVEISNVYLELGHYPQSKLFIKSLLEQEHLNVAPIRQQLEERLLYLETFTELLQAARIPKNTPYSKVPNLVKLKANIDTAERQKK
ncbi:hypothetical protein Psch_01440 [Pelotomaculum schinkii]|uniref:Uncharacterized protein n=1 Tax=Pelotomaculum schinkii TaxID=78350 RepID=A0A4Y7RFU8_9FIRM|nr:hypothetical protein [Pelotomaculum schinkii]TEB07885.1 hypothetical protein Psch_01440 [Pelotomaculum schinkii]